MTFWLLAAFLLLLTLFGTVWPLLSQASRRTDASDIQIYKDQLREIEKDIDRGTVDRRDGEASRTEISRRLLKASQNQRDGQTQSARFARIAAISLLVALPTTSILGYYWLGSPQLPDAPLQARLEQARSQQAQLQNDGEGARLEDLVTRVEAHLATKPEDGEGWLVIAPVYVRLGQIDKAVTAFENALRLTPKTPELWSSYGEAATMQASGAISPKARKAFQEARKLAPQQIKPRFYLALALSQDQNYADAAQAWQGLLADAPQGAPWVRIARAHLTEAQAGLGIATSSQTPATTDPGTGDGQRPVAALPGPGRADVEAAQSLSAEDRQAFINSMVEGLQARLDTDGGTAEEWVRLVRAYTVLGKTDAAQTAYDKARSTFASDRRARDLLDSSAKGLGLTTGSD